MLRWLKSVGETVTEHEPLIQLETDKVTVEVASPGAGVLTEILKQEQEEVAPGELLGRIGAGRWRPVAPAVPKRLPQHPLRPRANVRASGQASGAAARQLSPAVRRLLAEHSLEAASVRGTGEGGRITVADVMRHTVGAFARVDAPADSNGTRGCRVAPRTSLCRPQAHCSPDGRKPASHRTSRHYGVRG